LRKQINKSRIKELNAEFEEMYGLKEFFSKKEKIEIVDNEYIVKNNKILFFYHNAKPAPTLKLLLENNFMKKVIVDMGAIKFVTSGAGS